MKRAKKYTKWMLVCWATLALLLMSPQPLRAALTKTQNWGNFEWVKITNTGDSSGQQETGIIDVSDSYSTVLHIDFCLAEASAHDGTEIIVEIASQAGDDAWTTVWRRVVLANRTAGKIDFADSEAAGQTVLSVTDPGVGGFGVDAVFIFFEDTGLSSNCEIAYQIDNTGDAGDTITVIDGITHAKDSNDDAWTGATANTPIVFTTAVVLPTSASLARVIFNNWYDTDGTGADGYGRVRVTKMTGI